MQSNAMHTMHEVWSLFTHVCGPPSSSYIKSNTDAICCPVWGRIVLQFPLWLGIQSEWINAATSEGRWPAWKKCNRSAEWKYGFLMEGLACVQKMQLLLRMPQEEQCRKRNKQREKTWNNLGCPKSSPYNGLKQAVSLADYFALMIVMYGTVASWLGRQPGNASSLHTIVPDVTKDWTFLAVPKQRIDNRKD